MKTFHVLRLSLVHLQTWMLNPNFLLKVLVSITQDSLLIGFFCLLALMAREGMLYMLIIPGDPGFKVSTDKKRENI